MQGQALAPSDKDIKKAKRLCGWLGWLGAHRLYIGYIGTGLIWACTAGLFMVGWLYDYLKISSGTFIDTFGRPIMERKDIH